MHPLRVSLFETEPLSQEQRDGLGWPGREGIYTAHEALENYRLTHHGTLTGGSKVVRYRYGSRLPEARDPDAFARIEPSGGLIDSAARCDDRDVRAIARHVKRQIAQQLTGGRTVRKEKAIDENDAHSGGRGIR